MAVYTDITDAELEAFLAEFDLGQAVAGSRGVSRGVITSLNEAVSSVSSALKKLKGKTRSSPGAI